MSEPTERERAIYAEVCEHCKSGLELVGGSFYCHRDGQPVTENHCGLVGCGASHLRMAADRVPTDTPAPSLAELVEELLDVHHDCECPLTPDCQHDIARRTAKTALSDAIARLEAENAALVKKLATARALIDAQCGHIDAVNAAYEKGLAENAALREAYERGQREGVREMSPDFLMGEDGEVGFPVSDLGDLADDLNLDPGEVRRVLAYRQLPDRWLAHVVLTRDADGAPDETEPQLFDSEAEALDALAKKGQP